MSRARAEALDAGDPLAGFRSQFALPEHVIYLDGNSLGPLPLATRDRLRETVDQEWGTRLIRAWDEGWLELPVTVGDRIGSLLGAGAGQVVVGDSTSVCLYKLASAALDLRPGRTEIVTDVDNFPTDRYVLEGIARQRGLKPVWFQFNPTMGPSAEEVAVAVSERTALVSFSHVSYRSAFMADLAVGCTYKYLNGGPGAPAFMYVREELLPEVGQPIWGWLGRRDPFQMGPGYESATDVRRLLSGTPPVLGLRAVEEGVALVERAGIERVRRKGIALTELAIELVDLHLASLGVSVASPRDPQRGGAHVAIAQPDGQRLCAQLIEHGVIVDFRGPDVIRLGLSPLVTRFVDVWDAVEVLRGLV